MISGASQFEVTLIMVPNEFCAVLAYSIHSMRCSYAQIISVEKVYSESQTVTIITMSVFERDSTVVKCNSRSGECMTCCLIHCGDVVLKEVNAVVATTIWKRTILLMNPVAS